MALVHLVNAPGVFAEVDDKDAHKVAIYTWRLMFDKRLNRATYVYTNGRKRGNTTLHRFLFGDAPEGMRHDHIDGNPKNNRRANLRICDTAQNAWNTGARRHSSSGIKGVMLERAGRRGGIYRRWRATVVCRGIRHRQWFDSPEEADAWARAKRAELHGEFARHT